MNIYFNRWFTAPYLFKHRTLQGYKTRAIYFRSFCTDKNKSRTDTVLTYSRGRSQNFSPQKFSGNGVVTISSTSLYGRYCSLQPAEWQTAGYKVLRLVYFRQTVPQPEVILGTSQEPDWVSDSLLNADLSQSVGEMTTPKGSMVAINSWEITLVR